MPPKSCGVDFNVDDEDDNPKSCVRKFHVYIPTRACQTDTATNSTEMKTAHDVGTLPLVFAVHCFGCNADAMIKFEEVAEEFNFVLVRPEGIQNSWNSKYCCGYSLQNKVDDKGFFKRIIHDLDADVSLDFINKKLTYAVGWSNGGFMVTYAASLFRGIAPIAGYQYDVGAGADAGADADADADADAGAALLKLAGNKPTSIFQHHSINDPHVGFEGCCTDPGHQSCCCGISRRGGDTCTSVTTEWESWAANVNHCTGRTRTEEYSDSSFGVGGVTCYYGGSCESNTTLCVYDNAGHFGRPSFTVGFPMFDEIGHFFAQDACSLSRGKWSRAEKTCVCDEKTEHEGAGAGTESIFCFGQDDDLLKPMKNSSGSSSSSNSLPPPGSIDYNNENSVRAGSESSSKMKLMVAFLFIAVATFIHMRMKSTARRRRQRRRNEWDEVSTSDPNELEMHQIS